MSTTTVEQRTLRPIVFATSAGTIFEAYDFILFGSLPAIAFAMVAANGSSYFGLWYPLTMVVISILVLLFLLPETKGVGL